MHQYGALKLVDTKAEEMPLLLYFLLLMKKRAKELFSTLCANSFNINIFVLKIDIMIIKLIELKNFKGFEDIQIPLNEKINIIIGENNTGKSSIFEAILLWKKCFESIIRPNKTDFYKNDNVKRYLPFNELRFIRLMNDVDLFFSSPNIAKISLTIIYKDNEYKLGFEISKPQSIRNSYLRFQTLNYREFTNFATALKADRIKLTDTIFVYQAKPVANILEKEPFMNRGQILQKISLGKSGEVLRNKIIQRDDSGINKIAEQISSVLGHTVKIKYNNRDRKDIDEYIDLQIEIDNKSLDIHLQGSGLLQVAEIFSTIEFLSNTSINLLLIDEPDSHIHVKSQKSLLKEIKKINNVQSFIISHNDNFVSDTNNGELFYLSQQAKDSHILNALELSNYDLVKKELGGIIVALDKLNSTKSICFTEGDDDIEYIQHLCKKYIEVTHKKITSKPIFFYLSGKGDLIRKIDYYKRLLPQIVTNKKYKLVYDKDYCTVNKAIEYETKLKQKLGRDSSVFRHDGYCIESTLFSESNVLINLLEKLSEKSRTDIEEFVTNYFTNIKENLTRTTSDEYKEMNKKFKGQKQPERPELENLEFDDFLSCAFNGDENKYQYVFNKHIIKNFIVSFDEQFGTNITNKTDDDSIEYYASTIYKEYINSISTENDFLRDSIELLNNLFEFAD